MQGFDDKGYNPMTLLEDYTPSIPKDFPKKLIPENLCENEIIKMFKCTKFVSERDACQKEYTDFINCKKHRDIELFSKIKSWEKEHFSNLENKNQNFYLMGLGNKLQRLETEYERIPQSYNYSTKAWCYKSDIDQLKWRIKYLQLEQKKIQSQNKEQNTQK